MSQVSLFNAALKNKTISPSPTEISIIKMYLIHAEKSGRAFPSTETISRETGISRRTVFRKKAWLVSVGGLVESGRLCRDIPIYDPDMKILLNPKTYTKSESQSMTECHMSVTQSMTPCHPYKQKYINNRITTEDPKPVVDASHKIKKPDLKKIFGNKIKELYKKLQENNYDQESVAQLISEKLTKDVGQPVIEKINQLANEVIHYIKRSNKQPQHAFHIAMKLINEDRWSTPSEMKQKGRDGQSKPFFKNIPSMDFIKNATFNESAMKTMRDALGLV